MNIKFDEKYIKNFDEAVKIEWLETNKLGAYSSSTIFGLNSRKEHGLFVVPTSNPLKKINLLAKFEETVFVKDFSFELSSNQYENSIYPNGYKYLKGFSLNPFPTFHYEISDRKIDKSIILLHDRNLLIVRYELKNNGHPVKLIIKPIIAARYSDDLVKDIQGINPDSYMDENVVKIAPKSDLPEINLSYQKGEYTPAALWYHNFYYKNEFTNAVPASKNKEDLLNPGFFTYTLHPYDSFEIYVSLDQWYGTDYEYLLRKEKEYRKNIDKKLKKLPVFIQNVSKKLETIPLFKDQVNFSCLPDYHTAQCNIRNSILAMNDSLIVQKKENKINKFIENCLIKLKNGLLPEDKKSTGKAQNCCVDTSLQLINLGYHAYRFYKNSEFLEKNIFDPFVAIIESFRKGTDFNTYMDKDGLIFTGDKNTNTSFIPILNESGHVIRYGKLLEVNIFWLNALYIMRFFSKELNKSRMEKKFNKLIENTSTNFIEKFWDERNHRLYDLVRDKINDATFRINQIYALSLPFQILEKEKGKQLLYSIKNELLTSYGLRSLSNKDVNYVGESVTNSGSQDSSKFEGAVWPSSVSDFIIACVNYGDINAESVELAKLIENFEQLFNQNCLGYLPEYLDGDKPHNANGSAASIVNMLSIFKASFYFYKSKNKNKLNITA
ncbi:MAG: glycogen debranching enzyme N-terminal domain-containing protein [Calditrichia bacterium]|nr:glycogen debranching enzyme N-terminal domain-containing protein [Calditrichia bacterium]